MLASEKKSKYSLAVTSLWNADYVLWFVSGISESSKVGTVATIIRLVYCLYPFCEENI